MEQAQLPNDDKTKVIARIIRESYPGTIQKVLVVGCGSGTEAAVLAQELDATVVGIDLNADFDPVATQIVDLRQGDATRLDLADGELDLVYSYHALEHIPDFRKALSEMRRVLREGGMYCVGTPNRLRLLGYIGSKDATLEQKIVWNVADWKARLQGRFRNEHGAHAGFAASELKAELQEVFCTVRDITTDYYLGIYRNHPRIIKTLSMTGLGGVLFPSVYFTGKK